MVSNRAPGRPNPGMPWRGLRNTIQWLSQLPGGLLFVTGKDAEKGDLVFVNIPSSPVLEMAKERGYLNVVKFQQRYQTRHGHFAYPFDRLDFRTLGCPQNGAPFSRTPSSNGTKSRNSCLNNSLYWSYLMSRQSDSNRRPADYRLKEDEQSRIACESITVKKGKAFK